MLTGGGERGHDELGNIDKHDVIKHKEKHGTRTHTIK